MKSNDRNIICNCLVSYIENQNAINELLDSKISESDKVLNFIKLICLMNGIAILLFAIDKVLQYVK